LVYILMVHFHHREEEREETSYDVHRGKMVKIFTAGMAISGKLREVSVEREGVVFQLDSYAIGNGQLVEEPYTLTTTAPIGIGTTSELERIIIP
jgi:hypothetical protein